MFAVIKTGGRQYRVVPNDVLEIGKIEGLVGTIVQLGEVLVVGGDTPVLGAPTVAGASVAAEVLDHKRGPKVIAFKKPVAYVHGDSHYFRIDRPFQDAQGRRLENFLRVETFGNNQGNGTNDVMWLKVLVDSRSREVFSSCPVARWKRRLKRSFFRLRTASSLWSSVIARMSSTFISAMSPTPRCARRSAS